MESFDPVAYINSPRWQKSRLGLHRITELLDRLGKPQDELRFVHVAGTNGKGSTCAFLASILQAAGYKTGLFTSPYIERFHERIRVDGFDIDDEELARVTLKVRKAAEAMEEHPTEFELMTAVAFLHFKRQGCDICVVEVGLGGRLDSTNVITTVELSIITALGLDHEAILGPGLAAIAREKAGIIKEDTPLVLYPAKPEAAERIAALAATRHAPLFSFSVDEVSDLELTPDGQRFSFRGWKDLTIGLLGGYQPYNAACALVAVERLQALGWDLDEHAVRTGLAATRWPGRLELVGERPRFLIDGAHNPQGVEALLASISERYPSAHPVFLLGILADKDYESMASELLAFPEAAAYVTFTVPNPRSLSVAQLAGTLRDLGARVPVYEPSSLVEAVSLARELAGPEGLVVAFGSLYAVGALKEALRSLP